MKTLLIKISIILIIAAGTYSCGDCGLQTADYPCNVREATITKFDPRLVLEGDSLLTPVPTYSIHTFMFPGDNSSSGVLLNDTRFEQGDYTAQFITIAEDKVVLADETLYVRLVSYHPTNDQMKGDLIVIDMDSVAVPPTATLRFSGDLAKFPDDFRSEDAYKFCQEYLPQYRENDDDYSGIASQASEYGGALPNAVDAQFTRDNILIVNSLGDDVTQQYIDQIDPLIIDDLLATQEADAVNVLVRPGEVYYYKAANGKEFAVVIADIRQGTFEPFLKRVTIKFSELKGMKVTQCP